MPEGYDTLPPVAFGHLLKLTTDNGLYEHALGREPRPEHGYCTDDVARALAMVVRSPEQTAQLARATEVYVHFLERAVMPSGEVHNRMTIAGRWSDDASTDDWWGRALGGLGAAARRATVPAIRSRAFTAFLIAAKRRSPDIRASAFAALGATDVLAVHPECDIARHLLASCLARIPRGRGVDWPWPEGRLRYANAALCHALIVGGKAIGSDNTVQEGLDLLEALLHIETAPQGYFSLTGTNGRGPEDRGPLFDQQPIEAAHLSAACLDALRITGAPGWRVGANQAWRWFVGANDAGTVMYDAADGAGYDGLEVDGRNENCGAESTLAALSALQDAHDLLNLPG
jgi:hypothetical protein